MIKGLLAGESPEQVLKYASNRLKASEEELLDALAGDLSPAHQFVLTELMAHIDELEARIETFPSSAIARTCALSSYLRSLQTIPGLDETGAALLLVEIGDDMSAFGTPERLASWAGVCQAITNQRARRNRQNPQRYPYVRRILCEASNAASRTQCRLQDMFKGLLIRRGRKRAIFALAHKILKIVFY